MILIGLKFKKQSNHWMLDTMPSGTLNLSMASKHIEQARDNLRAPNLGDDVHRVWRIDDTDNSFSTPPFRIRYARQDVLLSIMISFNLFLDKFEWYLFEFIGICIGKYGDIPKIPEFPKNKGQVFKVKVMHSMEYCKLDKEESSQLLKGKKVAVIGYKKSVIDLAVECAEANHGNWQFCGCVAALFSCVIRIISLCIGV